MLCQLQIKLTFLLLLTGFSSFLSDHDDLWIVKQVQIIELASPEETPFKMHIKDPNACATVLDYCTAHALGAIPCRQLLNFALEAQFETQQEMFQLIQK